MKNTYTTLLTIFCLFSLLSTALPPMTNAQELTLTYERNCYDVNANGADKYEILATIGGGKPPYQVQVNSGDFFEVTEDGGNFGFEVLDGQGFRIYAKDSEAIANETTLEEELEPCFGLCADLLLNIHVDCQADGTGILNYEVLGANGEYVVSGNQNGDQLDLGEAFLVEVEDEQGCKTVIGGKCPLPLGANDDCYSVLAGDGVVMDIMENDIGEGLQLYGFVSGGEYGTIMSVDPETGETIYVANPDIPYISIDNFQYIVQDDLGILDTANVKIWIFRDPIIVLEGTTECQSACNNYFIQVYGLHPPFTITGDVQAVIEDSGDDIIVGHPFNEYIQYTVTDSQGNTLHLSEFVGCSDASYVPPCNPECENVELVVEYVDFICVGQGKVRIEFTEVSGGSPPYQTYFNYAWDSNELMGWTYQATLVDANNCYTFASGDIPYYCYLEAQDTSFTLFNNETLSFLFPRQDYWESSLQVSLIDVSAPKHGSTEWTPEGTITYIPDGDFVGIDSFIYVIEEGWALNTQSATVRIEVLPAPCTHLELTYRLDCTDPVSHKAGLTVGVLTTNSEYPYQISLNQEPYIPLEQGFFRLLAGENELIVQDANGCLSDTLQLYIPPPPDFTVSLQAPITDHIAQLEVIPAHQFNAPFQVIATFSEQEIHELGQYVFEIDTSLTAEFAIAIQDTKECYSNIHEYAFRDLIFVGIDDIPSNLTSLQVYPNPNDGNFTLSLQLTQAEAVELKLLDITGRAKLWQHLNSPFEGGRGMLIPTVERQTYTLTIEEKQNLTSGLYFLQVSGKDWTHVEKIMVE